MTGNNRNSVQTRPGRPPFWAKLPVLAGNLLQLAGIAGGVLLVAAAASVRSVPAASAVLAVLGIVLTAFCSHAIGHWLVGRLAGLRFAYIGIRGTDHPETYPPVVRQVLSAAPMFTTVSTRRSREAAGRWALAAYYAAGQTTAIIGWLGSAVLARTLNIPGSTIILAIMIAWVAGTALVATFTAKGDYAKAGAALRITGRTPGSRHRPGLSADPPGAAGQLNPSELARAPRRNA
jgi:hypothetical protein